MVQGTARAISTASDLRSGDLKYFLESIRRFKPYTLSEVQESLINLKDVNGIDALVGLYEMITNRFIFSFEVNGEQKNLTRDELSAYFLMRLPKSGRQHTRNFIGSIPRTRQSWRRSTAIG